MQKPLNYLEIALRKLIRMYDQHIHPKRVQKILSFTTSLVIIIALLFTSVMIGVVGFMVIEGYGLIDALYMTIITISTVGFGEIHELTHRGRIFVSFLILSNIGIFAYAISRLASFTIEGEFRKAFHNLQIGRKIDRMKDHIIVCGYGRYGKNVVEHFIHQNCKVVLIEQKPEQYKELKHNKLITMLDGDATDEETLKEAGIFHARALVSTLPIDADNVYVILSARQLNRNLKIISRANQAASKSKMKHAGADHVLIPENIGGFYMSSLVTKPDIINIFDEISGFKSSSFKMVEIILDPLPPRLNGKKLGDLQIEEVTGVKIIGVKAPGNKSKVNPSREIPLIEGMAIIVLGDVGQIERFHRHTSEFEFIE